MEYGFDLGAWSRRVTTTSDEAQTWFDRGLNWLYGFNHDEAVACFDKALSFDGSCAMAYWGKAYARGLNYNYAWQHLTPEVLTGMLRTCRGFLAAARANMAGATPVEQAIISALEKRYPSETPIDDLYQWSADYANAMREVYRDHPDDLDVVTLFADAMMNRHPWNLWDQRTGAPTPGSDTLECKEVLERAIAQVHRSGDLGHPGIWHYYVHLMEMSATPEKALVVADELRHLAPDAGHLRHMPTHIDIQVGNYHDAVLWNHTGIEKDLKYWRFAGPMNVYSLARLHNYHFKLHAAMLLGQFRTAMDAVEGARATVPDALMRVESPPMADRLEAYLPMRTHALIRFGRWQELVDDPLPDDRDFYCTTTAFNFYGKAIGYAALKDHANADKAYEDFTAARARVPRTRRRHWTSAASMFEIANEMALGEMHYHRGEYDTAYDHLRRSVQLDDALPYDEPWGWMMPTRHPLGALLLEQDHVDEAAAVYEADLGLTDEATRANRHPNNVWALIGLHSCYLAQGRHAEARLIKPALDRAVARADDSIVTSCFCSVSTGSHASEAGSCCSNSEPVARQEGACHC